MVAKINIPHNVLKALNYNEKKLQEGKAICIYAHHFLREGSEMNFYQKLWGLEDRNLLNDRATTKTLHISLNFDPSEKLFKERLIEVATAYMEKIGFSEQPYLVYQHLDAGHPHLHVVATTIRQDGSRIPTHNIGKSKSEKARKEIEQEFNLMRADNKKLSIHQEVKPLHAQKLVYGKVETKRGITSVLSAVIHHYHYTSLAELNAALRQFNVVADRGKEEGRIYKNKGLVYRMLDEKGNKIGVPIKASSIPGQPTLPNLEKLFALNELRRVPYKTRVKESIDKALNNKPFTIQELIRNLSNQDIYTLPRLNEQGSIYGITFVDNETKCVFNGSDLGKGYSAAALQSKLVATGMSIENTATQHTPTQQPNFIIHQQDHKPENEEKKKENSFAQEHHIRQLELKTASPEKSLKVENLLQPFFESQHKQEAVPLELLKKKRKKKRDLKL